jgi:hypothetical protein
VSSAYVNSNQKGSIEEVIYPAPADAEKIIHLAAGLNDKALKTLTPKYVFCSNEPLCRSVFKGGQQALNIKVAGDRSGWE